MEARIKKMVSHIYLGVNYLVFHDIVNSVTCRDSGQVLCLYNYSFGVWVFLIP